MSHDPSLHRVNRFVLNKQKLTGESACQSIAETVRDIGGLHATSPTTPYLSLFARVRDFRRELLDEELYRKRNLGKVRYVRTTVYVLPKDMIPTAFAATRTMSELASQAYSKFLGVTEKQYRETSKKIMEILKGKNGMTTKLIKRALGTSLNVSPIVNLMCDQGLLIRGAPEKSWKSNIHTYYLFSEYFPDMELSRTNEKEARETVALQYLDSFGPVTEPDIAWWTGFPKGQVRQIIDEVRDDITYLDVAGIDKTLLMLSRDETQLKLTRTGEGNVICMLPSLDPYMMGYKDRERYLDSDQYDYVFDRSGNATSTILLDGRVIGIWDFEYPFMRMFLFDRNGESILKQIHFKARTLGAFIADSSMVKVKECHSMTPLRERTAGGVMSPLRGC